MTVTFIDVPGELVNTSEPIDFTTTARVVSISVEFRPSSGNGLRETVFDGTGSDNAGGDFSYLYRNSTVSGSGPYSWTVRRIGAWPAEFRIRVKEETASGLGSPWGTIYDMAITTSGNVVQGANSFAGLTWYGKNTLGASMSANTYAPGGMRFTAAGGGYYGEYFGVSNNNPGNYRHVWLPLAQVPNYNPASPLLVQARMAGMWMILTSSTDDGVSTTLGDRAYDIGGVSQGGGPVSLIGALNSTGVVQGPNTPCGAVAILRPFQGGAKIAGVAAFDQTAWTGAFRAVENYDLVINPVTTRSTNAPPNPGLLFVAYQIGGGYAELQALRISQPKG